MLGMMGDKKKFITAILSERTPKPMAEEVPNGLEADFEGGYESIAADMISAFKAGEPKKLASSLKEFVQMCVREDEYSEEEESDDRSKDY